MAQHHQHDRKHNNRLVWALVLASALLLCGALTRLLSRAQSCGCEQTYMYTSYTEVPVLDPAWSRHRYRLRLYRELAHPKQALPPTGHPALLIPGNAGSYEQVRALASETARLTDRARRAAAAGGSSGSNNDAVPEIDWYALDLRGELSAFDGQLLQEQQAFALACLRQLAAMYGSSSGSVNVTQLPPMLQPQQGATSSGSSSSSDTGVGLLLLGHSMGGVVARAAAAAAWSDPLLGPGSISLLLTLASPHVTTPLMLQPALSRFYAGPLAVQLPQGLPVVSLHGGAADMQVSPLLAWVPPSRRRTASTPPPPRQQQQQQQVDHLWHAPAATNNSLQTGSNAATATTTTAAATTSSSRISPPLLHLTQPTLSVPGVWLHAGHTQIDWCNQLVTRLAAGLLEVVAQQQQHEQQGHGQLGSSVPPAAAAGTAGAEAAWLGRAAVTSQVLLQYLSSDVLNSLTDAKTPQPQQQQQLMGHNHSPPDHMQQQQQYSGAVPLPFMSAAPAAPAPPVSLSLLLPSIAPEDVRLTHLSSCQHDTAAQHSTAQHGPGWYINSQGAVAVNLPDPNHQQQQQQQQQALFKAFPSAGAAGGGGDVAGTRLGGAVYMWDVAAASTAAAAAAGLGDGAAAAANMVLLASGVKPCSGFRVWVGHQQQQGESASNSSSTAEMLSMLLQHQQPAASSAAAAAAAAMSWVDVSPLVVPLPVVQDALVLPVRDFDAWEPVMLGRDYLAPAAWTLTLQPNSINPAPGNITHVAVWLAPPPAAAIDTTSTTTTTSSGGGVGGASVTMQWIAAQHTQQQPRQQQQWPQVSLGLLQLLWPLQRPAGGPMLLQVNLKQHSLLQQLLSLQVVALGSSSSNSSGHTADSGSSCWQPVALYSSLWGGQQHALVLNTTLTSANSAAGLWGLLRSVAATWLRSTTKASKVAGSAAARYTQLQLSEVATAYSSSSSSSSRSDDDAGHAPRLLLLLDPTCSYRVQLGWDFVGAAALLLLGHASAAAGIAVALLLLVLSHQMSSLVRVMSIARHGTVPPPRSSYSANAAGGVTAAARGSSPIPISSQRQQQLGGGSRRCSPSPSSGTTAAAVASSGAATSSGYLLSLPSPAAGVARRLVRSASYDDTSAPNGTTNDDDYNDDNDDNSNSDNDQIDPNQPLLLGPLPRYQQQQQQPSRSQQPSVAGSDALPLLFDPATTTFMNDPLTSVAAGTDTADAEWGLSSSVQQGFSSSSGPGSGSGFRQPSLSALQRLRRQMAGTLGGAPPPIEQQLALASAAAAGGGGGVGGGGRPPTGGSSLKVQQSPGQQQQQQRWLWSKQARPRPLFVSSSGDAGGSGGGVGRPGAEHHQQHQQQEGVSAVGDAPSGHPHHRHGSSGSSGSSRRASSWSDVGISVLGSLMAVTGDTRVLLLVGLMSAAAGSINSWNPDSIWYHSSSGSSSGNGGVVFRLLQRVLGLFGLLQRGDSPGVVGAAVLLGVALLVLLVAVGVSIALKWCLDYVTAAVAAFNRSLTPDPSTLEAIQRASQGGGTLHHTVAAAASGDSDGSSQHVSLLCGCALCTAAQAACGGVVTAAGGLCGLNSSGSTGVSDGSNGGSNHSSIKPRAAASLGYGSGRTTPEGVAVPPAPAQMSNAAEMAIQLLSSSNSTGNSSGSAGRATTAAAGHSSKAAAMRSGSSFTDLRLLLSSMRASPSPARHSTHATHTTAVAATAAAVGGVGGSAGSAAAAAASAVGRPWWQQRRSQVLVVVLLLLTVTNLALGLGGAVLLLFMTWHLPSSSTKAGQRAAQLLLGARSRNSSRAASRTTSPAPHTAVSIMPAGPTPPPSNRQADLRTMQRQAQPPSGSPGSNHHQQQLQAGSARVRSEAGLSLEEEEHTPSPHQLQQQQQLQSAVVYSEAPVEGDSVDADLQLFGLQPLEKLGTINSLLQQERARRDAEAATAALQAAAAEGQHMSGPAAAPQQPVQQQQQTHGSGRTPPPALGLPQLGLPPLPPTPPQQQPHQQHQIQHSQQQQQRLVHVAGRFDSTGARALALHQLTCHMCHAWLLLYCCCFWMLLPSLLAWAKLPLGQQHLSHPVDVLTLLPVILHCVAISAGRVDALVGFGPATAAANWRASSAGTGGVASAAAVGSLPAAGSSGIGVAQTAAGYASGSMAAVALGVRPLDLHKLAVRAAAAYMFAAALLGQAVRWTVVVALVAVLMLAGRQAVEGWYRLHALWLYAGRPAAARFQKQKGT